MSIDPRVGELCRLPVASELAQSPGLSESANSQVLEKTVPDYRPAGRRNTRPEPGMLAFNRLGNLHR